LLDAFDMAAGMSRPSWTNINPAGEVYPGDVDEIIYRYSPF
jgi:hypothetical protein